VSKLLEAHDLVIAFGDGFSVGPADFAFERGVVHLVGPNGGGKTTLMRGICGELLPARGEARVGGASVHRSAEARRRIAFVPSIPELPEFLSVAEAYEFAASLRGAPGWDGASLCAELELDPRLPLGSASAGQRRKAELICGLAADPEVILLDETFAHLDERSVGWLRNWIVAASASRLILLSHHGRPPVAVDAAVHVESGRVSLVRERGPETGADS
jgi:ABC-type multidrug transport system ATPase subunit